MKLALTTSPGDGRTRITFDPSTEGHLWPAFVLYETYCEQEGEAVLAVLRAVLDNNAESIAGVRELEDVRLKYMVPELVKCLDCEGRGQQRSGAGRLRECDGCGGTGYNAYRYAHETLREAMERIRRVYPHAGRQIP